MRSVFLALITITVGASPLSSQWLGPFPAGLIIEAGGGHNQLLWRANADPPFVGQATTARKELSFTPTVRVSYQTSPVADALLQLFIGYDQFGGRSGETPTGYRDEFWIEAMEAGMIATYRWGWVEAGGGLKHKVHLRKRVRSYGSYNQPELRTWHEEEEAFFFGVGSTNVGLRTSFHHDPWILSGEAWFGISGLEKPELDRQLDIREDHFRILAGYRL